MADQPEWHSGFRMINSRTEEVVEGLITKDEYDWLTFQRDSLSRECNEYRKRLGLA